jgi:hypothetical protein
VGTSAKSSRPFGDKEGEAALGDSAEQRLPQKVGEPRGVVSLYFMHYYFARVHQTLRVTPIREAGLADHVWSVEEIATLL